MVMMHREMETDRLVLKKLQAKDYAFMFKLVNSPGWLECIGDRNIKTEEDARAYTEKIVSHPQIMYWTVTLKTGNQPAGIVTIIKREGLEYHDIGFAFLPGYTGAGYSFEATRCLIEMLPEKIVQQKILAVTTKENSRSIRLLEKLKFKYDGLAETDGKTLLQYALSADEIQIGKITRLFFSLFNNILKAPDFKKIDEICSESTSIVRKSGQQTDVYGLDTFIEPRKKMLTDGTLQQFTEFETEEETVVTGTIACRHSKYRKKGWLNGNYFEGCGHKFFHFMKGPEGWKIVHVIWEDEQDTD